jgi:hypothetical protein
MDEEQSDEYRYDTNKQECARHNEHSEYECTRYKYEYMDEEHSDECMDDGQPI